MTKWHKWDLICWQTLRRQNQYVFKRNLIIWYIDKNPASCLVLNQKMKIQLFEWCVRLFVKKLISSKKRWKRSNFKLGVFPVRRPSLIFTLRKKLFITANDEPDSGRSRESSGESDAQVEPVSRYGNHFLRPTTTKPYVTKVSIVVTINFRLCFCCEFYLPGAESRSYVIFFLFSSKFSADSPVSPSKTRLLQLIDSTIRCTI